MMTEASYPSPPADDLCLLDRFENLHSRTALMRDICAMLATEAQTRTSVESISREGWRGLFLLGEESVRELERLTVALSELAKEKPEHVLPL